MAVPVSAVIAREAPATATGPTAGSAEAPRAKAANVRAPFESESGAPAPNINHTQALAEPALPASASPQIDKRLPPPSPSQLAEIDYRDGANLLHQGRGDAAQEKFRSALQHHPGHASARQALVGVLIQARRTSEAEQVLHEGLRANAAQPGLAMALARLQVDRGDTAAAIETLRASSAAAAGSAEYIAFIAALLQRQSRHAEAVEHYQAALGIAPGSAIWQMGLGISLQALNRQQEARAAYRRAISAHTLSPELAAFVDQQLRQLN
jgi:MSHA biogenesis protein MshN